MATATTIPAFSGFRREAIQFLIDLAEHNDRAWFQPRKAEYEQLLKEPLEALCLALSGEFAARDLPLRSDPGRSPFRIYRDVRFSKDKSPYKTHVAASFPYADGPADVPGAGHSAENGGGYFHLSPGEIYIGGGVWHPEPGWLTAWRNAVLNHGEAVHAAIDDPEFIAQFGGVHGDSLKRVPTGMAADHPDAVLLKLKDVTFGRRLSDDDAFSPQLPAVIADAFAAAVPVMRLLSRLPD